MMTDSRDAVPTIAPVAADSRPLISVAIPTFEPQSYLVETIRSVLSQDPGIASMQIAVIDDGSKRAHPRELLEGVAPPGRIEYYEHDSNVGLAANWNRALRVSRGQFVHILHQDDTVCAEFYSRLLSGLMSARTPGMAFSRHAFVDQNDHVQRISHRERWRSGILSNWIERISERQRIQCPAAIVRRDVYEALGGFRRDLSYALDWEMWVRIACKYDVWYEPEILAHYRRHSEAESARLQAGGQIAEDLLAALDAIATHLPQRKKTHLMQKAYRRLARQQIRRAAHSLRIGHSAAADQLTSARLALDKLRNGIARRWLQLQLRRVQSLRSTASVRSED